MVLLWLVWGVFFAFFPHPHTPPPPALQFSLALIILHLQPLLAHSERINLLKHMLFLHWKANPLI